ncbi:MAG TPA: hypothetical protein VKX96_01200, partial [Chloroflexota bacterium]|nr:hypothetical protein [Chloroflexota bacterium]
QQDLAGMHRIIPPLLTPVDLAEAVKDLSFDIASPSATPAAYFVAVCALKSIHPFPVPTVLRSVRSLQAVREGQDLWEKDQYIHTLQDELKRKEQDGAAKTQYILALQDELRRKEQDSAEKTQYIRVLMEELNRKEKDIADKVQYINVLQDELSSHN